MWYDPANPQKAYLEGGSPKGDVIGGWIIGCVGLLGFLSTFKTQPGA